MKQLKKMKKRGMKITRANAPNAINDFARGFVATGLIAALERNARDKRAGIDKHVLYRATQGGIALVAAVTAGHAVQRKNYIAALAATVAGAAGIYAADRFINNIFKEPQHHVEEV